jgi:hypothetical protein
MRLVISSELQTWEARLKSTFGAIYRIYLQSRNQVRQAPDYIALYFRREK